MRGSDLYHVGIVVPSREEAMTQLTEAFGLRWGPAIDAPQMVYEMPGTGEQVELALRLVYSVEAPHIELVEEIKGTPWECNPYSNLHHIGFWGDVSEAARGLVGGGCPIEIMGVGDERGVPAVYSYHQHPLGIRAEIVDTGIRDLIAPLFIEDRP